MAYLLKFGGFVFPAGFAPMSQDSPRDLAEQERPRAAGSVTQAGRALSRKLTVEGSAMGFGGGPAAIQAAIDAIRGAEGSGGPQPLYFGRDDRYVFAQYAGITESYQEGGSGSWFGASHKLALSFVAGDPYFYAVAATTAPGLSSAGGPVTPGGNAPAFATWTITVSAGGTGTIVLANTTTGETATLGSAATVWTTGDVIILTRTATSYTLAYNGSASPGLLLGLIPTLQAATNGVTLSATAGIGLGALQCVYTARWQS